MEILHFCVFSWHYIEMESIETFYPGCVCHVGLIYFSFVIFSKMQFGCFLPLALWQEIPRWGNGPIRVSPREDLQLYNPVLQGLLRDLNNSCDVMVFTKHFICAYFQDSRSSLYGLIAFLSPLGASSFQIMELSLWTMSLRLPSLVTPWNCYAFLISFCTWSGCVWHVQLLRGAMWRRSV